MTRQRAMAIAALAVAAAVIFLLGLGRLTSTREQEVRIALVAREVVRSGDWLIPRLHG